MSIDQKDYSFSDADELEGDEYRGISKSAVVAVFVALASPLTMVHGLLAIVPVAAVILSLIALHGIARGESLVGRKAALFAMGLALFVLAWSISRSVSRHQIIENQAESTPIS